MSIYRNVHTGLPNMSEAYATVVLPNAVWVAVEIPANKIVVEANANVLCIVQQATTADLPDNAPDGTGALLQQLFQISEDVTHLHLYQASGSDGMAYFNFYNS